MQSGPPEQVPYFVTAKTESQLREQFRRTFLHSVIPDEIDRSTGEYEWYQTAGAALDRRLWGYQIDTTLEQDERLIESLNARPTCSITTY